MPDIAFMTYIHNGEKTMRKSIESVLSQESVDLAYYLIDNASTDGTWEIMQEYAAKDSRVRLIQNENSLIRLPEYIKSIRDCEYFAVLDADDWYEPAFAEETIAFMEKEDLDIAAVGICFHDVPTGEVTTRREEKGPVVVTFDEFKQNLKFASLYFIAMWGKVFKTSVVQAMDFSKFMALAQRGAFLGVDTIFALGALRISRKIGILDQVLFQYLITPASDSRSYHANRFYALVFAIEMWLEVFVDSREMKQTDVENFVKIVKMYYHELMKILEILIKAEMDAEIFLEEIKTIAESPLTETCMQQNEDLKEVILALMINKIQKQGQDRNPKIAALFYDNLKAIDAVDMFKKITENIENNSN